MKFDMEAHYRGSLSTAIVNIMIQCGFENSSKRALDEIIGVGLKYMKNITKKIVDLTNECNLEDSDVLVGLCALKLHGLDLEELFLFLQNYNEIFPPPPKVFFGPVPLKIAHKSSEENKPSEIVSWAPELTPALSTIGLKLKNDQIVPDPNFDQSKLRFSYLSPKHEPDKSVDICSYNIDNKLNNKYGSICKYQLPQEAMPNKYEAPTIDFDSTGNIIGVNGKLGKLPDPFISDMEEQDLMQRKSSFVDHQDKKSNAFNALQLFNGICKKVKSKSPNYLPVKEVSDEELVDEGVPVVIPDKITTLESIEEVDNFQRKSTDKNGISDDAWNAALQATIEPIYKPEKIENNNSVINAVNNTINDSKLNHTTSSYPRKRSKKHRLSGSLRPKKKRKVVAQEEPIVPIQDETTYSNIYHNESTMDSHYSVLYSSTSEREIPYNPYPDISENEEMPNKSPSLSPILESSVPKAPETTQSHISYPESVSTYKSSKTKKKSHRKTHLTNKRKKKPPQQIKEHDRVIMNDDNIERYSHQQYTEFSPINSHYTSYSGSGNHQQSRPSVNPYTDDDNDPSFNSDSTQPMQESSQEMINSLNVSTSYRPMSRVNSPNSVSDRHNHSYHHNFDQYNSESVYKHYESPTTRAISNINYKGSNSNHKISDQNIYEHREPFENHDTLDDDDDTGSMRLKIKIKRDKSTNHKSHFHHQRHQHQELEQDPYRSSKDRFTESVNPSSAGQSPSDNYDDDRNSMSERLQMIHGDHSSPASFKQISHSPEDYQQQPHRHQYYKNPYDSYSQSPVTYVPNQNHKCNSNIVTRRKVGPNHRKSYQSNSSHSSPQTLPAYDDCDKKHKKSNNLKTGKLSSKKKSRNKTTLGTNKKVKTKKPSKTISEQSINRKGIVSVTDVFSDDEDSDPNKYGVNNNHHQQQKPQEQHQQSQYHHHHRQETHLSPVSTALISQPIVENLSPQQRLPLKISRASKSKNKSSINTKFVEPSPITLSTPTTGTNFTSLPSQFTYCCAPGEAHYTSTDGAIVYICPICTLEDNGSLMVCCDRCQDWYHGACLNLYQAPDDDAEWFCPRCLELKVVEKKSSNTIYSKKSKSKSRTRKK